MSSQPTANDDSSKVSFLYLVLENPYGIWIFFI